MVEAVRTIYDRYSFDEVDDLDAVARALGHIKAKSGAFLLKLATLRAYGLVEGRGRLRLTEVGCSLASPSNRTEEAKAVEEAIKKIPLWRELYSRFGPQLPEESFTKVLVELTGCSEEEAREKEGWVRKAYLDDVHRLKRVMTEEAVARPVEARGEYIELRAGDVHLRLPFDLSSIEVIENVLNLLKKYISKRESK